MFGAEGKVLKEMSAPEKDFLFWACHNENMTVQRESIWDGWICSSANELPEEKVSRFLSDYHKYRVLHARKPVETPEKILGGGGTKVSEMNEVQWEVLKRAAEDPEYTTYLQLDGLWFYSAANEKDYGSVQKKDFDQNSPYKIIKGRSLSDTSGTSGSPTPFAVRNTNHSQGAITITPTEYLIGSHWRVRVEVEGITITNEKNGTTVVIPHDILGVINDLATNKETTTCTEQ